MHVSRFYAASYKQEEAIRSAHQQASKNLTDQKTLDLFSGKTFPSIPSFCRCEFIAEFWSDVGCKITLEVSVKEEKF